MAEETRVSGEFYKPSKKITEKQLQVHFQSQLVRVKLSYLTGDL